MTDQDTLNKLFDAALKEPEKPKPEKPKFAPGPVGSANGAGAATSAGAGANASAATLESKPAFKTTAAPVQDKVEAKPSPAPQTKAEPEKEAAPEAKEETPQAKEEPSEETSKKSKPDREVLEVVEADPNHEPHGMLYMCVFLMISLSSIAGAFWFFFLR